jgi:hypothetical protein
MLQALKRAYYNVTIRTCFCILIVRCIKLFLYYRHVRVMQFFIAGVKVFDNLCTEVLTQFITGFTLSGFVDFYQDCHLRIANSFYKIYNMLFQVIMSLCYVCNTSLKRTLLSKLRIYV